MISRWFFMKRRFLSVPFIFSAVLLGMIPVAAGYSNPSAEITYPSKAVDKYKLQALIEEAKSHKAGIRSSSDGSGLGPVVWWVPPAVMSNLDDKIREAETVFAAGGDGNGAYTSLAHALAAFDNAKLPGGGNPMAGDDPGEGPERVPVSTMTFDSDIAGWSVAERANDGRIHTEGDITWENAFGDGKLKLSLNFDGVPNPDAPADQNWSLDGVPMKAALPSPINLTDATFIQFDFYYPMNSQGKLMRFELWSTTSGGAGNRGSGGSKTQAYIRPDNLEYLNGPVAGEYGGQAFRVKKITMRTPVTTGTWEDLRLDIHGESATAWSDGVLFIDNVTVLQQAPGDPIPPTNNANPGRDLPSIKEKYNDRFLIGTTSPGANGYNGVTGSSALLLRHFNTVTPGNSLKADSVHPNPPQWLMDATGYELSGNPSGPEYTLTAQDEEFGAAQENGYKMHGHVLAWFNQGARWMTQIVPENVTATSYNAAGNYFSYGNGAAGPFYPVSKDLARRAYYNHILYELRHFMTTDSRYTNNTGIIGFHSFDVLNEEIHETRHTTIIPAASEEWKTTLRNTSWLRAMTDDDYGDITQHYVYLLFKFAHIAVPNAQMAVKYRANYASLPDWMKQDNHDDAGSIDGFISPNPPILYYNDYDLYQGTKAKAAYNMIRELNIAWQNDPLYDGRPLIEGLGIQGHDTVGPALANQNRETIRLFADLIDQGLLTAIAVSELDLVIPDGAPGGAASSTSGDVLNQKQADAIGYQYALLFKVYIEFSRYIERITLWGTQDPGWGGSYKPFDFASNAAPGYYGIMDPDRFIAGHSYLDAYFEPLN